VESDAFQDYARSRLDRLRRTAYLLCGNWHTADDLTSIVLSKLYRKWRRISTLDEPDAYVRKMLLRAWLDELRRPWRRERATATPPDRPDESAADPTERMALLSLLNELPPRRRAVIVLRYFNDLSVEDTAEALGCSTGTVKSQTARALDSLRERLSPRLAAARKC